LRASTRVANLCAISMGNMSVDVLLLSGERFATLRVEPSMTGAAVKAAINSCTHSSPLMHLEGLLFEGEPFVDHETAKGLGLCAGSELLAVFAAIDAGIYWASHEYTGWGFIAAAGHTTYTLHISEDADFVLTRVTHVGDQRPEDSCWHGHFEGGRFLFDNPPKEEELCLWLDDSKGTVSLRGSVWPGCGNSIVLTLSRSGEEYVDEWVL